MMPHSQSRSASRFSWSTTASASWRSRMIFEWRSLSFSTRLSMSQTRRRTCPFTGFSGLALRLTQEPLMSYLLLMRTSALGGNTLAMTVKKNTWPYKRML